MHFTIADFICPANEFWYWMRNNKPSIVYWFLFFTISGKLVESMGDILFSSIEKLHGTRLWGKFLDAGTGLHSLKWVQTLATTSWTAITADHHMKSQIQIDSNVSSRMRPVDRLLVGNWMDEKFCQTLGQYDTILADYLIGAVDGFSPYEQDTIIRKLSNHLLPNGRLYFIGMNPIPDEHDPPGSIISEIRRARDSCILLAGHRPYREFPLSWMKRHIESSGLVITSSRNFTILHSEDSALRQIKVARSKLDYMANPALQEGMKQYLNDLEERTRKTVRAHGKIPLSYDYVIAAEKLPTTVLDFANNPKNTMEGRSVPTSSEEHDHNHDGEHDHDHGKSDGDIESAKGHSDEAADHHH